MHTKEGMERLWLVSQQRRLNIASRLMGEILRGGGDYTWTRAVNKINPFSWLE